ncbi:hypothetical protein FACS189492_1220 [Clostridia bacterium]|nr:hypothetical protein FACS189492_1220 [Clostridia bacterium]
MKRKKTLFFVLAAVLLVSAVAIVAVPREAAKQIIVRLTLPPLFHYTPQPADRDQQRVISRPIGFYFDLPRAFSSETDGERFTARSDYAALTVTREWATGRDVDAYIAHYLNRFILSADYQAANNIRLTENVSDGGTQKISAVLDGCADGVFDKYTYVFVKTGTKTFYRVMFKYAAADAAMDGRIEAMISSFRYFSPRGRLPAGRSYSVVTPESWTADTQVAYQRIRARQAPEWGIFAGDIYGAGIDRTIPALEEKLRYQFPVILAYTQFGGGFPLDFMQKCHAQGRLVELTLQTTSSNNEDLFGYTPFLDLYRGGQDGEIRAFARAARVFGHPFLFRLDNEPNSDWTSYAGVVNLSDPEIYVANWRRIYRIFEEEGVGNAIWIFNPNDRSFPPCDWNEFSAYYPGDGYVHMLGVTGYNTGTYYPGETWREFDAIYGDAARAYRPAFGAFPWMITEFASSSVGGNKERWIGRMFQSMGKYPEIKIAVWFNHADYEGSGDDLGAVARPYWLDETPATLEAFRNGLNNH